MEFVLMFVAILFILPFPAKWKFVKQLRILGLALAALTGGFTLVQMYGLAGQVGGGVLIAASVVLLYLALRQQKPSRQAGKK